MAWGSENFAKSVLKESSRNSFTYLQIQAAVKVSESFLINLGFKPSVKKDWRSDYFNQNQFSTIGIQAFID